MNRDNSWIVSRRLFLRSATLAGAAFSAGVPLASGSEGLAGTAKLRFGMVSDSHYADAPENGRRFYRESLAKMGECVALMNAQKVDFLIELGDFKDQAKPATEQTTLEYLDQIEKVFEGGSICQKRERVKKITMKTAR